MKKTYILTLILLISINISAQTEQCGTMKNLEEKIKNDPLLKLRLDSLEDETQRWIKENKNSRLKNHTKIEQLSDTKKQINNGHQSIMSLCGNNNTYYTTISAPTSLNQIVSPSQNCTYGGEYVRVTGMVAGNIYRVSTCGVNNFDTQLSIYNLSGFAVAHNDDACGSQSEILFNPIVTETFDVLIDQYNCTSNTLCASLQIELIYTPRQVITIPVVVHVVHFGEAIGVGRNISDAQIQSQIDALNRDFRRYNTDIFNVPAAFRGISDDPLVEFCLAQQDEFGNPTTGIKRWLGSQPNWDRPNIESIVKPSTIWDRNKYLNIWTLEFGGSDSSTLGYAQFLNSGAANTDGVVIRYNSFGTVGNVSTPFNLGRTSTHEVGHWLNLRHIWGDDGGACTGDDLVFDTPNQAVQSIGVPSFPVLDVCTGVYPGINFHNYMDYSDDAVTLMFTFGQAGRMDETLFGFRNSLRTSNGCQSSVGIIEPKSNEIVNIYPNPTNGIISVLSKEIQLVNIKDVSGKILFSSMVNADKINIDLTDYSKGIYFIEIQTTIGKTIKKIVKQ